MASAGGGKGFLALLAGAVEGGRAALGRLLDAVPFLKKRRRKPASAAEPFASLLDGSGSPDALVEPNAARAAPKVPEGPAFDARAALDTLARNRVVVGAFLGGLVLLLAIAIVALLVAVPPARPVEPARVDPAGAELVSRFLLPPDPALEDEGSLERPLDRPFDLGDWKRFGIDPAGVDRGALSARNDATFRALLDAVP